ncbi:unnamed protein product [Dovyalis caffra]|uniref:caffeate O-methyltransferase n=1 Tax=Dovyalis caffra TaxID=77055 RepID=A0AAV1SFR1_9ROSI|nr:unnamed protein product [Dovyalis caffra]
MASLIQTLPKLSKDEQEQEESFSFAMQLALGSVLPMAMQAAIELEIFEIIAKAGPDAKLSGFDISKQMPTSNPAAPGMLDRILRLLASHGVLGCSLDLGAQGIHQRLFSLTPASRHFVRNENEDAVSLGPLMIMTQNKVYLESWSALKEAVLEGGIPFNKVHGMHVFEYSQVDSNFSKLFNTGMINHTTIVIKKLLETYKGLEGIKQLVDVGGGLGVTLDLITSKYPNIKGINFDLPRVIQNAPPFPGVEHVEGDMFQCVPQGDAIFMKWILHNWSDEHCLKLLKNCYKSIPSDGKVIVMDAVLTVMPENSAAARDTAHMDVFMLTQNHGGKERTQQEFVALAIGAGFSGVRFECCIYNFWVMEFFK